MFDRLYFARADIAKCLIACTIAANSSISVTGSNFSESGKLTNLTKAGRDLQRIELTGG
jgi:hypothetical protein